MTTSSPYAKTTYHDMTLEELLQEAPELMAPAMRARLTNKTFRCTYCKFFGYCNWASKATHRYMVPNNMIPLPVCRDWKA